MANCKVCNVEILDGTDLCDDCRKNLIKNDEQYLDQLLAAVTGNSINQYQLTEDNSKNNEEHEFGYEPITYTQEEIERQNSKDDDWNLLNQTINKQPDKAVILEYDKEYDNAFEEEIPVEGALDEVDNILIGDYCSVLQEITDGLDDESEQYTAIDDYSELNHNQGEYLEHMVADGIMEYQDDIMDISDELVEEDMNNSLVNQEVMDSLDDDIAILYDTQSPYESIVEEVEMVEEVDKTDETIEIEEIDKMENTDIIEESGKIEDTVIIEETDQIEDTVMLDEIDDNAFLASLLENDIEDTSYQDGDILNTNLQDSDLQDDVLMEMLAENTFDQDIQQPNVNEQVIIEPELVNKESTPEMDDELSELDKLLEEVTEKANDYSIDNIMLTDSLKENNSRKVNTSDILSESLSAVSNLDDDNLETQFNNILPNEKSIKEIKKGNLFKKIFGNVPPENPELELKQMDEEEKLEEEKKQQKLEEKQKKLILKEENKERKAAQKEIKQKALADKKEKKKKARDAIAAAYVPEGKINRIGATVVFVIAACVAIFIIQGTSFASYQISIKSAEKDFKNARYDEAYETLSGEKLKEKDEIVYDKLQTIMVVKKELNSYYNFRKMNMELEALNSVIKGIDRFERYYTNALELKIDAELNSLKKQLLTILKDNYKLTEKETIKLIKIQDSKQYTNKLEKIVKKINNTPDDTQQIVKKNK